MHLSILGPTRPLRGHDGELWVDFSHFRPQNLTHRWGIWFWLFNESRRNCIHVYLLSTWISYIELPETSWNQQWILFFNRKINFSTSECKTLYGASLSNDAGYSMIWSGSVNFAKRGMIHFYRQKFNTLFNHSMTLSTHRCNLKL